VKSRSRIYNANYGISQRDHPVIKRGRAEDRYHSASAVIGALARAVMMQVYDMG